MTEKQFFYGAQFHRPPNPPRAERRQLLEQLAREFQFNMIRVWPSWDYYNPAAETFAFDEIEELMAYADQLGLRVLMGVMLEMAPYWLEQEQSEARYVDAKGQPVRFTGSSNNVTGGWPGLCLDWEVAQQAATRYIRELVSVVAPHKSMYGYDCWNEPHIEPAWPRNIWYAPQETFFCYCPKTVEKFHHWLEGKYGNLRGLNEAWTRRYPNWQAVDPPRLLSTYMDWVDWGSFIIEKDSSEMQWRTDTVRAADPQHPIGSHAAHTPPIENLYPNGISVSGLARPLDFWGLSLFPRWEAKTPMVGTIRMEVVRSSAPGKEFWLTELQGGHGNIGLRRSPMMRPQDIRLWNWLAVANGAKAILYWNYQAEATGFEATGFGLVTRAGETTDRAREAARNNQLIQAHWDIIKGHRPKPQVALLFDQDNALLTFAMIGNTGNSTDSFLGYYRALWEMDLHADFIGPAALPEAAYKVIIVPWHLIGKKGTCTELLRYVERGGTLILETGFGMFDERCYYNPVVPPHGLREAFGYREGEAYVVYAGTPRTPLLKPQGTPPSDEIHYEPEIAFTEPVAAQVKGNAFLTPLQVDSARVIGKYEDLPVAVTKKVGKGEVYYFGTNLGASIHAGNSEGLLLLDAIIRPLVQAPVTAKKLRPRLVGGEKRSLLVVIND